MVADDGALGGLPEEDVFGPDYECRYEDEYDGVFYGSFGALLSSFEEYAEGDGRTPERSGLGGARYRP